MKAIHRIMAVFLLLAATSSVALAQSPPLQAWGVNEAGQIWQSSGATWTNIAGAATHVSVASDGSVWAVNAAGQVYQRAGSQWQELAGSPALSQVSVRNASEAWGLGGEDEIFHWDGAAWKQRDGRLSSISAAADGSVWGVNRGGMIFRRSGDAWQPVQGQLVQISAARDNDVWGVNVNDDIWRWNGSGWAQVPGKLRQVTAGADGTVWGIAVDGSIVRREGEQWKVVPGGLVQVAVANPSTTVVLANLPPNNIQAPPVVITNLPSNNIQPPPVVIANLPSNYIQAPAPQPQPQQIVIQGTTSIDVTPSVPTPATPEVPQLQVRGTIDTSASPLSFGIGPIGTSKAACGTSDTGKLCAAVPATFAHNASAVCPSGTFVDVGRWSCWSCPAGYARSLSAVDSDKACQQKDSTQTGGYLTATFQGRLCEKGSFFDPIRGGECYSCPEGYKRSATHIDAPNACYIAAGESLKPATRGRRTIWPHECSAPSFWDGLDGGSCWSCPSNYRRTAYAVNASNACATGIAEQQARATKGGKAACGAGEIFDLRIKGDQDISSGGGCWTCPIATDRTALPVDGGQACNRPPGLRFATAMQEKALNCETNEIFDPISSSSPNMANALKERNLLDGPKETANAIGGTCWTCPAGSKRNVNSVYGGSACQPTGITWKSAAYNQPGLFGLKGAEAVALKLVNERTTINSVIAGLKQGPEGSKLPADFARITWDLIGKSPQDSAVLQAAVFSRVVAAANDRAQASPEEIILLDEVKTQVRQFRVFIAQDALNAYRAWNDNTTFRQNQYARSQLQTMVDTGEVPPDFEEITIETILGSLAANHAANAAVVATMTSEAVFKSLFPHAQRARHVFKPAVDAVSASARLAPRIARDVTKGIAEGVKTGAQAAGGMTATLASIGPQIIITIGIEILAVAIEQQIDIANAEPKLLVGLATANNLKVDFARMMATTAGNSEAQGYWANLMAGPAKSNGVQPAAPMPRNLSAFTEGARAANAAL